MGHLLEQIRTPDDVKKLSSEELINLGTEIREEILSGVSRMGGHLSSNLGVVETTVALLYTFDLSRDQIVWDVGHQSYAYKLLTGRHDLFSSLRTLNGYSGFPKREESAYDFFNTGHSSTSISAALGLLRAKHLKGEKGKVIAVIGDGALTGGMAYEALDDTGQFREDLIVILNDNEMSIDKNVGGMSRKLRSLRANSGYLLTKTRVESILKKIPGIGDLLCRLLLYIKKILRMAVNANKLMFFEDMGFRYFGPVDGHDISALLHYLQSVKDIKEPVLLHICTKKGNGYSFAEEAPTKYHGVTPFDSASGQRDVSANTFTSVFGKTLTEIADEDSRVTAVCAAMKSGTGLDIFRQKHKLRFFDVGIAEEHALTMAAGMAVNGMIPVVAIYSTFIQRGYDQILHDICLQKLHVVLAIDRAGIVGPDGETHQGLYDMALLLPMPNIEIFAPRNFEDLKKMLSYAVLEAEGPVAIRYPRASEALTGEKSPEMNPDVRKAQTLKKGNDIIFISVGYMAGEVLAAAEILGREGISCEVMDLRCVKPIDEEAVLQSVIDKKLVVVCEDAVVESGVGTLIASMLLEKKIYTEFVRIGVHHHPVPAGTRDELWKREKMDREGIADICRKHLV